MTTGELARLTCAGGLKSVTLSDKSCQTEPRWSCKAMPCSRALLHSCYFLLVQRSKRPDSTDCKCHPTAVMITTFELLRCMQSTSEAEQAERRISTPSSVLVVPDQRCLTTCASCLCVSSRKEYRRGVGSKSLSGFVYIPLHGRMKGFPPFQLREVLATCCGCMCLMVKMSRGDSRALSMDKLVCVSTIQQLLKLNMNHAPEQCWQQC